MFIYLFIYFMYLFIYLFSNVSISNGTSYDQNGTHV